MIDEYRLGRSVRCIPLRDIIEMDRKNTVFPGTREHFDNIWNNMRNNNININNISNIMTTF
jgi:hypothetical protein